MSDENALRQKAREAIQAGKLPNRRPERMWGGPGNGADCAICGESLSRDEVGFDLQYDQDGEHPGVNHQVHVRCFAAWERERENLSADSTPGPPLNGYALRFEIADGSIVGRERDTT